MNGIEFIENIKTTSTLDELMNSVSGKTKTETQSKKGNLYEKIWSIVIKTGFCDYLPNDRYDHYDGNMNTGKLKKIDNLETYLQKMCVFGKGCGGASDITLKERNKDKWIFISSKFYLNDSKKSIDDYDVDKILAVINQHLYLYKEFDIYLIVNNKNKVLEVINSSNQSSDYLTNNICHILDLHDLSICYVGLKNALTNIEFNNINDTLYNKKKKLTPRFHQEMIVHKQMEKIDEGETDLLLGAKARSGKTYCVGYLMISYYKKYTTLNSLIITPAPTETLTQFTDDMFKKFSDFDMINIIEIKKGTDFDTMELYDNNVIIVSKQLIDDYVDEDKIMPIKKLELDFIVFDENHFHGTTSMSKNIIKSYSSKQTIKLYLTATYSKPLIEWNIPSDCQFYWDIEDEQLCKKRDVKSLTYKHGDSVMLFLNDENLEQKLSVYDKMPDLHIITNLMDRKRYEMIKERIKDTSYGFANGTLLSGSFSGEVDIVLRYITGSNRDVDYQKKDLSIFGRIKKIASENNSRTQLNNNNFTSQLWFLPFGINLKISKVSEHLKERMLMNNVLNKYEIKIVNSKKEYKIKDIKEEIKNWEIKAKNNGKDGLILLAGNQLTLGITLPFVDIVFLFNDIVSSDKIIQMMYRCMTESIYSTENDKINNGIKNIGFVVDLNISRVLNTLLDYNVYKKDLNVEQKLSYIVENNLINIDCDLFQGKDNKTKLVDKLLHIWKSDPINNLKILLRRIEENIIELDSKDQHVINQYFANSVKGDKINVKVSFDEEVDEELKTGREIIKQSVNDTKIEDVKDDNVIDVSLTKDVLPFLIPLVCILTINHEQNDLMEMLKIIKNNPSLLSVFNDQSYIWWNNEDIINMIETIVKKYISKNSHVNDVSVQFKMSLNSLLDEPKELLELIDSCLKPKQKEKQENGEVFTPMNIVFEMLDRLDEQYIANHGKSIFTNKHFKWFDPASGMGNFPVAVYIRLVDGLKEKIPNEKERKKHILENMIYMSELNKKNVFISHQIFNINNQYKLNMYEGDTLFLDISKSFNLDINGFDVVLGNPPYNKGGIRSHTGKHLGDKNETIWTKFIDKSFKEWLKPNGFLVFINPLSWLKKSHSLHNAMLNKHIVWLKLWDNIKSLATINGKIPISLFILQNTENTTNKTLIMSEIQSKKLTTTST